MNFYVPSSTCASIKLVTVAFPTLRHHNNILISIPFLLLLLLSKRPSALPKLSKSVVFIPIASTDARGVRLHQEIVIRILVEVENIILYPFHIFLGTKRRHFIR